MCAVAVVCILSAFSFGFLKRNGPLTAVKIVSKRRKGKGFLSTLLEAFTTTILVCLLRGTCKYAQEAIYWPFSSGIHADTVYQSLMSSRPCTLKNPFAALGKACPKSSLGVLKWWPRRCLVCPKSLWRLNHTRLLSWMLWWPRELGQLTTRGACKSWKRQSWAAEAEEPAEAELSSFLSGTED